MDLLIVRGGKRLTGRVAVSGSKNAALPIMAASLLVDGPVRLTGVPDLADVSTLRRLLESLGVEITTSTIAPSQALVPTRQMQLQVRNKSSHLARCDLVRRMRASICVLGPLLAKRRRAIVSLPGGCNLGDRPIDLHLHGLAALGAEIRIESGFISAQAKKLKGTELSLAGPRGTTVTGTANILMAAVLARGRTIIHHAAHEPEIVDLARFLNAAGANIAGAGTDTLEIEGVEALNPVTHSVITDRIEAATLMLASAMTAGDVVLDLVPVSDLTEVFATMAAAGIKIDLLGDDQVRVRAPKTLVPVDISTSPFPGFPTDLQAQWTALMTGADGASRITDSVFPERFLHIPELNRLGASIERIGPSAFVRGNRRLSGANLMASDLRASAALVLAALSAQGESAIRHIYHLDRGYERLEAKLNLLGADIVRRPEQTDTAVPAPQAA